MAEKRDKELLSIGEFAKITRASVKSLRYYERIGVLDPAYVDPETGYRYYHPQQIYRVSLIRMCVEEDLPISDFKRMFDKLDGVDALELFETFSELAQQRARKAFMTLTKMESYELECKFQIAYVASRESYVKIDPVTFLATPYRGSLSEFHYGDYAKETSRLLMQASECDILTLARQGLHRNPDGTWHTFVQVHPEGNLEEKLQGAENLHLIRISTSKAHVRSFQGSDADSCFREALAYPTPTPPRWIIDCWAIYMTMKSYATMLFY